MKCSSCKYAQSSYSQGSSYYEDDTQSLCFLTDYGEQTDVNGLGCRLNQRTLDYRYRKMQECNHTRLKEYRG